MADLAVTTHQHASVALSARANGNSSDTQAALAISFEQLLQGGAISRHPLPPTADLLRAERQTTERQTTGRESRPANEIAELSRRRVQAERTPTPDHSRHASAARPERWDADRERGAPSDTDSARHLNERPAERADRRRARPISESAGSDVQPPAASGTEAAVADMPVPALPQWLQPAGQGTAAQGPAPGGNRPSFTNAATNAAEPAEPQHAMTAPARTPASVTMDADILISQPGSALAPAAVIAAESLQGQGYRLRGDASGSRSGIAMTASGGIEGPVRHGAEISATLEAAGPPAGGPQTAPAAGTALAGGTDAAAAVGAGSQAQGQNSSTGQTGAAITAAAGGAASPPDKPLTTPSAGTALDTRAAASVNEGTAFGGAQTAQQATRTAGPEAPARAVPFQQRIVSEQVSVHIRKAVQDGTDRIEIRLKPEALGRVDVRLELGPDSRVVATVTADQRHTLELLRADARSLERALQEAGLQTDGGSLNFNLRSGNDGRPDQHNGHATAHSLHAANGADGERGQESPPQAYGRRAGRPDGIDIRA